jgi:hypothetical protein
VWTEWRAHPDTLPAAPAMGWIQPDVAYYRDPLRRLVDMHSSTSEMTTGRSYRPPWWHVDSVANRTSVPFCIVLAALAGLFVATMAASESCPS